MPLRRGAGGHSNPSRPPPPPEGHIYWHLGGAAESQGRGVHTHSPTDPPPTSWVATHVANSKGGASLAP